MIVASEYARKLCAVLDPALRCPPRKCLSARNKFSWSVSYTRPAFPVVERRFFLRSPSLRYRVTPLLRFGLVGGCFYRLVELVAERPKNSDVSEVDELLTGIKTFAAILLVCLSTPFRGVSTKPPVMSR